MNETRFSAVMDGIRRRKYSLGDYRKGLDCLSSLYFIYKDMGLDFPLEWKGYNHDNYAARFKSAETDARKDFEEFLSSIGEPVENPRFMRMGDLLVFEGGQFVFPAVHAGSGKMYMIWDKKIGGVIAPIEPFKNRLKMVRRLIA